MWACLSIAVTQMATFPFSRKAPFLSSKAEGDRGSTVVYPDVCTTYINYASQIRHKPFVSKVCVSQFTVAIIINKT